MFDFLEKMCAYIFGHKHLYVLPPFRESANMQYMHPRYFLYCNRG
jgi:hypothetical protein